jgi:hypothetical protein
MSRLYARFTLPFAGLLMCFVGCGSSGSGDTQPSTGTGATTSTEAGAGTGTGTGTATTTAKLVINELQPANKDTASDENGDFDDWIEIYNPEATTVDLRGYSLGDSANKQIINGSLPVPAGGYVLIWADDSPSQGSAHLGFKLSAKNGDTMTLTDPSGKVVDTVTFGPATDQDVYARFPSGTGAFAWCTQATAGAANGSACGAP